MITTIITGLRNEQAAGAQHFLEFAERLDEHMDALQAQINDMATLKAWALDCARARTEAIDALIGPPAEVVASGMGGSPPASQEAAPADVT